jgi:predicted CXXCH cytochrome family protein
LPSTHANSTATVTGADLPWRRLEWVVSDVAGNACLSCHAVHSAESAERLIARAGGSTCYGCHDGTPAGDVAGDFAKLAVHPVDDIAYAGIHDATKVENAATMPLHVECMDCHNPHTVTPGALPMISFNPNSPSAPNHSIPPEANSLIQGVTGIDINGNAIASVTNQYELCFKCHGRAGKNTCESDRCGAPLAHDMIRADMISAPPDLGGIQIDRSIRDRVYSATPGLLSWHPIESNNPAATAAEVPSLRTDIPLNTSTSLIYCTDCHNSDQSEASGGVGPNGPHGSTEEGLLADGYVLDINSTASDTASYALCYKCHDELTIKSAASFNKHDAHIGNRQGSCMKCHDPHGSHQYPRLINFLWWSDGQIVIDCIRQKGGGTQPCDTTNTGGVAAPVWVDTGSFTGECWLSCHGTGHAGKTY